MSMGNSTASEILGEIFKVLTIDKIIISLFVVLLPATTLAVYFGKKGFAVGLTVGTIVGYITGFVPFWATVIPFPIVLWVSFVGDRDDHDWRNYEYSAVPTVYHKPVYHEASCVYCGKTDTEIEELTYQKPYKDQQGKQRCGFCGAPKEASP